MIPPTPEVKDIRLKENMKCSELMEEFARAGGFTAKMLADAREILREMLENNVTKFLSFPACIVATGTRGVLVEALKRKWFDVVITTCGTWDHDIARTFASYYHGDFLLNDEELAEKNIHRLGNVLVPLESYGLTIENFMRDLLSEVGNELSTYELSWEIGKRLNEESLLYWAWKNKIPVIVPAPYDGAVGYQIWLHQQSSSFRLNLKKDEDMLDELVAHAEKTGALIIGGGVSKHHLIWWNQFRDGLDYAVQITTAVEWDGSLSGARTREAISWHKIKKKARHITVPGDATLLLPLLFASLL